MAEEAPRPIMVLPMQPTTQTEGGISALPQFTCGTPSYNTVNKEEEECVPAPLFILPSSDIHMVQHTDLRQQTLISSADHSGGQRVIIPRQTLPPQNLSEGQSLTSVPVEKPSGERVNIQILGLHSRLPVPSQSFNLQRAAFNPSTDACSSTFFNYNQTLSLPQTKQRFQPPQNPRLLNHCFPNHTNTSTTSTDCTKPLTLSKSKQISTHQNQRLLNYSFPKSSRSTNTVKTGPSGALSVQCTESLLRQSRQMQTNTTESRNLNDFESVPFSKFKKSGVQSQLSNRTRFRPESTETQNAEKGNCIVLPQGDGSVPLSESVRKSSTDSTSKTCIRTLQPSKKAAPCHKDYQDAFMKYTASQNPQQTRIRIGGGFVTLHQFPESGGIQSQASNKTTQIQSESTMTQSMSSKQNPYSMMEAIYDSIATKFGGETLESEANVPVGRGNNPSDNGHAVVDGSDYSLIPGMRNSVYGKPDVLPINNRQSEVNVSNRSTLRTATNDSIKNMRAIDSDKNWCSVDNVMDIIAGNLRFMYSDTVISDQRSGDNVIDTNLRSVDNDLHCSDQRSVDKDIDISDQRSVDNNDDISDQIPLPRNVNGSNFIDLTSSPCVKDSSSDKAMKSEELSSELNLIISEPYTLASDSPLQDFELELNISAGSTALGILDTMGDNTGFSRINQVTPAIEPAKDPAPPVEWDHVTSINPVSGEMNQVLPDVPNDTPFEWGLSYLPDAEGRVTLIDPVSGEVTPVLHEDPDDDPVQLTHSEESGIESGEESSNTDSKNGASGDYLGNPCDQHCTHARYCLLPPPPDTPNNTKKPKLQGKITDLEATVVQKPKLQGKITDLEATVVQALLNLEKNSDLKRQLRGLCITGAKEIAIRDKKAIVISVPAHRLSSCHSIRTQLERELQNTFGRNQVVFIAQRPQAAEAKTRQAAASKKTVSPVHILTKRKRKAQQPDTEDSSDPDSTDDDDDKFTSEEMYQRLLGEHLFTMTCNVCGDKMATYTRLHKHLMEHVGIRSTKQVAVRGRGLLMRCKLCHMYVERPAFQRHYDNLHAAKRSTVIDLLGQEEDQEIEINSSEDDQPAFECRVCGQKLETLEHLQMHECERAIGDTGAEFSCMLCEDSFSGEDAVKRHISDTHSDMLESHSIQDLFMIVSNESIEIAETESGDQTELEVSESESGNHAESGEIVLADTDTLQPSVSSVAPPAKKHVCHICYTFATHIEAELREHMAQHGTVVWRCVLCKYCRKRENYICWHLTHVHRQRTRGMQSLASLYENLVYVADDTQKVPNVTYIPIGVDRWYRVLLGKSKKSGQADGKKQQPNLVDMIEKRKIPASQKGCDAFKSKKWKSKIVVLDSSMEEDVSPGTRKKVKSSDTMVKRVTRSFVGKKSKVCGAVKSRAVKKSDRKLRTSKKGSKQTTLDQNTTNKCRSVKRQETAKGERKEKIKTL